MSGTSPVARGIVRIQGCGCISLPVVVHVQATLLIHDFRERVGPCKCQACSALADHFHLQAVVVGVAIVGFRPDAVPVWVPARNGERVARRNSCRGRVRREATGGRRTSGGIPLLPIHDFVVGVVELDVACEMPALRADVRDFDHTLITDDLRLNTYPRFAASDFLKPLRSSLHWPALAKTMNLPPETA